MVGEVSRETTAPYRVTARMRSGERRQFVVYAPGEARAREVFAFALLGSGGVQTRERVATDALEVPEEVVAVERDPGFAPTPVVDERKAPGS
jgi:hypothetical protein